MKMICFWMICQLELDVGRKMICFCCSRYCKVNFGDVSAVELWHLFSSTVEGLFDNDSNLEIFGANEYITLLFTVSCMAAIIQGMLIVKLRSIHTLHVFSNSNPYHITYSLWFHFLTTLYHTL